MSLSFTVEQRKALRDAMQDVRFRDEFPSFERAVEEAVRLGIVVPALGCTHECAVAGPCDYCASRASGTDPKPTIGSDEVEVVALALLADRRACGIALLFPMRRTARVAIAALDAHRALKADGKTCDIETKKPYASMIPGMDPGDERLVCYTHNRSWKRRDGDCPGPVDEAREWEMTVEQERAVIDERRWDTAADTIEAAVRLGIVQPVKP